MKQQMPSFGVWLGRAQSWLLSAAVIGTLAAPAIVQIAGKATDTRSIDNRLPAPFPRWPGSFADAAAFREGVGKFIDDNFGLRAELVLPGI